jgi:hypothetical protein
LRDELLGTDEENQIEYDPDFGKQLFENLIENLSNIPSSNDTLSVDDEDARRRRRGKLITRDNFTIDDIMGEFELDDRGNIVIDLTAQTLLDN